MFAGQLGRDFLTSEMPGSDKLVARTAMKRTLSGALFSPAFCAISARMFSAWNFAQLPENTGWPTYGNASGGSHYSAAPQINRTNVNELKAPITCIPS
jgi:glucose dehydrogenase